MDNRRFDDLARTLASSGSRRRLLARFLGVGIGVTAASAFIESTDAARCGFAGPRFPWNPEPIEPGPCFPFCGVGICGIPNGCGGTCACEAPQNCILGACAKPCGSLPCDYCLVGGGVSGCFAMMTFSCSGDTDCQAQFGSGVCQASQAGPRYCFVPQ